jgi:hypothetical protein
VTTGEYQDGPPRNWRVLLRLAIDADDADAARIVNEEVLHAMDVVARAEPRPTRSASPQPCWYVVTEVDLSILETITPDDAPTRFKFVIRNLPYVPFMGQGDSHRGLWEWLPDSLGLAMGSRGRAFWEWLPDKWRPAPGQHLLPHPAVRAAGVLISDGTTEGHM